MFLIKLPDFFFHFQLAKCIAVVKVVLFCLFEMKHIMIATVLQETAYFLQVHFYCIIQELLNRQK